MNTDQDLPFLFDINQWIGQPMGPYHNEIIARLNDHAIRISVMSEPYFWHIHPNSDETFYVLEGELCVAFSSETITLSAGQGLTVPKGVPHRTWPKTARSVNLTFEKANIETVRQDLP